MMETFLRLENEEDVEEFDKKFPKKNSGYK